MTSVSFCKAVLLLTDFCHCQGLNLLGGDLACLAYIVAVFVSGHCSYPLLPTADKYLYIRVVSAISRIAISVADVNGHEVNAPGDVTCTRRLPCILYMYVLLINIFLMSLAIFPCVAGIGID